jgi:hypothetical protein
MTVVTRRPIRQWKTVRDVPGLPVIGPVPFTCLFTCLQRIGNGAGRAGTKWSTADRASWPPLIRFTPEPAPNLRVPVLTGNSNDEQ